MADKKKAKYFCENCNSEVAWNARFCPKCGKFFAAVRCPECGYVGSHRDFKTGCPKCHYSFTGGTDNIPANADGTFRKAKLSGKSKKRIKDAFASYNSKHSGAEDDGVPSGLFIGSIVVLLGIFIFTFFKCQ
ncbi:zinc ribbon domain-containing protein [Treponema sp.]|uniref:zinc ribbon domain-containing protein n=1 Tax=Treponema sp. TaxID=166 RepID=UPI0025D6F40D|nr:zinc ribbon domain-containing protein [Treponema sp.]MCR5218315.1 zinc ribbon domain-containing protein [Treponema sp.]